jgi:DamX protein
MRQPLAYYKTTYKGGIWYPLLYGIYPSAEQAREAINTLPESIRAKNPWIRRLSAIQRAIRNNASQPPAQ